MELCPDIGPEVVGIVERLMAKNPDDRHQTPKELLEELAPLLFEAMARQSKLKRVENDWDFWLKQLCMSISPKNRLTSSARST